jgi:hypothetical protein
MAAYCTDARLSLLAFQGARASAYSAMSASVREAHLEAASRVLDGYLRAVLADTQLPLGTVGADVELWVAEYSAWTLLRTHGFDAPSEGNSAQKTAEELTKRAKDIAAGLAHLSVSNSPIETTTARVRSKTRRGWTDEDTDT